MSAVRRLTAGTLAATVTFLVMSATGCGSNAVGIDKCRSIEDARCEAGASCGLVEDVEQCKLYYRDQCLHGLAHGDTSNTHVEACVKTIQLAGNCAKKNGTNAKLSSCATPPSLQPNGLVTACDIVQTPQQTGECAFLAAVPPEAGASTDAGDAAAGDAAADAAADAKGD